MQRQADAEQPSVTVVIPALNEAESIGPTVQELRRCFPEHEVLVIDDGSSDETGQIAVAAGARVLYNQHNMGYGASLKRGIRNARGDQILFMDGDGQHDCGDIPPLLEELQQCDMVVGERSRAAIVAVRRPGKWILSKVANYLVGRRIPDINSGFRAFFRNDCLQYLPILPNGFSLTTTLTLAMMRDGKEVRFLPINVRPRSSGKSTVRYLSDGAKTILLIARVIMLFNPLRIFAPLSVVLLLLGGSYTVFTLITEHNISDSSVLVLLSALACLFLGLIADQIAGIRRGA